MGVWFPKALRADRDFMLALIKHNCSHLQFASDELKADHEIIRTAIRQDPFLLRFAAEPLKADFGIVLDAMRVNKDALQYAEASLKSDRAELEEMLNARMILTLHVSEFGTQDGLLHIVTTKINGDEATTLSMQQTKLIRELKMKVADSLGVPVIKLGLLLPTGQQLADIDESRPLSEVFRA